MELSFTDAHIHLAYPEYDGFHSSMREYARNTGTLLLSMSTALSDGQRTLQLKASYDTHVLAFLGIHPWSAAEAELGRFDLLLSEAAAHIDGIGEVGLDRKYVADQEGYARQKAVFQHMLMVAERLQKPVSIHARGSYDDVLDMISGYRLRPAVLHWFNGETRHLRMLGDRGDFVSFGPTLVYSKRARGLAAAADPRQLLTETDGPVRYGACFQDHMAFPMMLPSVVHALSEALRRDFEATRLLVMANARRYLGRANA